MQEGAPAMTAHRDRVTLRMVLLRTLAESPGKGEPVRRRMRGVTAYQLEDLVLDLAGYITVTKDKHSNARIYTLTEGGRKVAQACRKTLALIGVDVDDL